MHLGAWHARNMIFGIAEAQIRMSYPHAVGQQLGISASWVLPDTAATDTLALPALPALHELTHGLDEMLT